MLTRSQRLLVAAASGLLVGMLWLFGGAYLKPAAPPEAVTTLPRNNNWMAPPVVPFQRTAAPPLGRGNNRAATPDQKPATPPSATAPERFARAPEEWQGMLQEPGEVWPCPEHAIGCGMARACVDDLCTPCIADGECLASELCVLGVCLVQELVGCQSSADCLQGEVCMMSGFTPLDDRNNRDLKSKCVRDHWNEDLEDRVADEQKRIRDEADLAYQNSTIQPAPQGVSPPGESALRSLRDVLR